ncbi:MAG: hypothetical protein ACI8VW_000518 [bacterium]|jgi:hypothetical protein
MFRFSTRAVLFAMLGFSMSVQADTLGPLDGRSPDSRQMSEMSVEVGYVSEGDFSSLSGRLNYQYTPLLTLYGDFGFVDVGDNADGNAFGIGARYYLDSQRIMPELDLAVRVSYHMSSVDAGGFVGAELDRSELALAVHFGGKEAFYSNGIKWYGVVSYNRLSAETMFGGQTSENNDSEIGIGGGVYMPLGPGEIYVGVENIDDMFVGVGYRHFLGGAGY